MLDFRNYWFDSGTPSFLVNLIREQRYSLEEVQQRKVGELAFSAYELENLAIVPLLYQTGYLTIKSYDPVQRLYELCYPNREVEDAFLTYILFKLNGSAEAALDQIKTSAYYERYQRQGKPLRLIGVNFSTRKRGVTQWVTNP